MASSQLVNKKGYTDSGTVAFNSVAANTTKDVSVTFRVTFPDKPIVLCSINSSSTAGAFGKCACSVVSVTTTGATLRFFNGDTSARSPGASWVAFNPYPIY